MPRGAERHGEPSPVRRRVPRLVRARLAHRRGEAALLLVLAALLVAAAATGPLYERAVEQAAVRAVLDGQGVVSRGLEVSVDAAGDAASVQPTGRARELFDPPVVGTDVPAQFRTGRYPRLQTTLTHRDRQCEELTFTTGRCPTAEGEVVTSTSTATALGLQVGSTLAVRVPTLTGDTSTEVRIRVVGLYQPFSSDDAYWFGHPYSSSTGLTESDDGLHADAFFGTEGQVTALADQLQTDLPGTLPRRTVDLALRADDVSVDDVGVLRGVIAGLVSSTRTPRVSVVTGLSDDLDAIDAQRNDARTVVLVLAVQLAALAAIALGVVVAAAADQRRPELALLRLRGLGRSRTALALTRELGLLVALAVVPGVAVAWLVTFAAAATWLGHGVHPEARLPVVLAAVVAAVAGLVIVFATAWRTVRAPISALLRQVGDTGRRGIGLGEVAVAVVAVAGLVTASVGVGGTGDGTGSPLALLTPTCVAVLVGIVLSRLVEFVARRSGGRQLARAALARGLGLLAIARRTGARLTVVILTVATALVVFAAQQDGVASAARAERAAAVVGAPVVLQVSAANAPALRQAVRAADPDGRFATPVVVVRPPGVGSEPVVAVDPSGFGTVATWGRPELEPSARTLVSLTPTTTVRPVTVTTSALTLRVSSTWSRLAGAIEDPGPVVAPSPSLTLTFQHGDGRSTTASFGPLPARTSSSGVELRAAVSCTDGCRLASMGITRPVLDDTPLTLDLGLASLTTGDGAAVDIGPGSAWASLTPDTPVPGTTTAASIEVTDLPVPSPGIRVQAVDVGGNAIAQHLDVPLALPVLAAGPPPTATDDTGAVTAATFAGGTGRVRIVGSLPFIPQIGSPALLEDIDLASATAPEFDVTASPAVWLAVDDPAREAALTATLRDHDVDVVSRSTTAAAVTGYAQTAPGWSNQLALVAGAIAELLAVLLVALVVLTGRAVRQRDLAGLRLVGIDRRTLQRSSLWELGVLVAVGMVGGVVAGLIGVRVALPSVPIFVADPPVPIPVVHPLQWGWLVGAVALGVVLLVPTVVVLTRRLVAGARPARVSGDDR
ncbi:FtsX-like permease family protein [Jatrophihabitans sp. YIM 134969]